MLVDKQSELMSDLLFTVHQHGGDDVTRKPPIGSRLIHAPLCTNSIIVYFCLLVFTVESLISDHPKCENLMVAYESHWVFFFGR